MNPSFFVMGLAIAGAAMALRFTQTIRTVSPAKPTKKGKEKKRKKMPDRTLFRQ